jgi:hypothetical protein
LTIEIYSVEVRSKEIEAAVKEGVERSKGVGSAQRD